MLDKTNDINAKELVRIRCLLQHLLAVELFRNGVTQVAVAKHVGVATAKVNKMLKGIKKGIPEK